MLIFICFREQTVVVFDGCMRTRVLERPTTPTGTQSCLLDCTVHIVPLFGSY